MAIFERASHQYAAPDGSKSGLIPIEYSSEIIQEAVTQSAALSTFRRVNMGTKVEHLPVLDALPIASWVNGEPTQANPDDGMKPTTTQSWKGVVLHAEVIAAIVPIPEEIVEDSSVNLWAEVRPRIAEAIGASVDAAVFSGTNKPTSWPAAIIPAAIAAGNQQTGATPTWDEYNDVMGLVEADGFMVDQIYARTTQMAAFRGFNANGVPVYLTDVRDDKRTNSLLGTPVLFDKTGYLGTNLAVLGDPTKAILGVRQDIEAKFLDQATIDISPNQDGSAMVNLAQQDAVALRVRARFAYATANPVTYLQPTAAQRFPFSVLST